jgi:hypothetical protein
MNNAQFLIYLMLKTRPGHVYIAPSDPHTLYGMNEDGLLTITGPDFSKMDAEEIDEFVKKTLTKSESK